VPLALPVALQVSLRLPVKDFQPAKRHLVGISPIDNEPPLIS
jgi:hypothetical protein